MNFAHHYLGWANAIEPAPFVESGLEYLALTDSEEGLVIVLSWDGSELQEVASTKLEETPLEGGIIPGAATSQWLD